MALLHIECFEEGRLTLLEWLGKLVEKFICVECDADWLGKARVLLCCVKVKKVVM